MPEDLKEQIEAGHGIVETKSSHGSEFEATTRWSYELLSNAVYRAGFATSQASDCFSRALDSASSSLQEAFARAARDAAEGHLAQFLLGHSSSQTKG